MFILEANRLIKEAQQKDPNAKVLIEDKWAGIRFKGEDLYAYYKALSKITNA